MTRNEFNRLMLIAAAPAVLLFCGQSGVAQGAKQRSPMQNTWHPSSRRNARCAINRIRSHRCRC